MFLQVKDLSGQKDARTQTDRADCMQGRGEGREALDRQRSGDVENRHQQQHRDKARHRGKPVPVGGDKQQNARAQQHPAQADGDEHRPAPCGQPGRLRLVSPDTFSAGRFKQPGVEPALQILLPALRHCILPEQAICVRG